MDLAEKETNGLRLGSCNTCSMITYNDDIKKLSNTKD